MVAYDVALIHHSFYQVRSGGYVIAHQEKCGGGIMLFQRVQNRGRVAVFITGVKGEIENLLIRLIGIIGIELLQIFRAGVGHRRLSVLLEA